MRKMRWSATHGGTAGCTMRLTDQSQYCGYQGGMEDRMRATDVRKRELFFGDSWFTSIKAVQGTKEEFGHEYFGALKTNHSGTPKEEIETLMDKWNPGSYLVLECEEHGMWILGYKYSHRKKGGFTYDFALQHCSNENLTLCLAVCVFLGSWNSVSSTPGKSYIAKWPDEHGNIRQRPVPRPEIVGEYFGVSNKIDTHNQLRQNELGLEQLWVTTDPWFRLVTTIVGMTVTDSYQLARYSASDDAGIKGMSIREYSLRTSYDLFHRKTTAEPFSEILLNNISSKQPQRETSNLSLTWAEAMEFHQIKPTQQRNGSGHLVRRACSMKEPGCDGRPGTKECSHEACMAIKKAGNNRFGDTFGIFICENTLCRKKHWMTVAAQSRNETNE